MRGFVSGALIGIAVVTMGCGATDERVAEFQLSQQVPLGILNLAVTGWEEVRRPRVPLGSLTAADGEKPIAVFVRWNGLDGYSEFDRRVFAERFLDGRLRLVDDEGYQYETRNAMPRALYLGRVDLMSNTHAPRDWVVVFHVWVDSHAYTLRVEHPSPGEDDFSVARVSLG